MNAVYLLHTLLNRCKSFCMVVFLCLSRLGRLFPSEFYIETNDNTNDYKKINLFKWLKLIFSLVLCFAKNSEPSINYCTHCRHYYCARLSSRSINQHKFYFWFCFFVYQNCQLTVDIFYTNFAYLSSGLCPFVTTFQQNILSVIFFACISDSLKLLIIVSSSNSRCLIHSKLNKVFCLACRNTPCWHWNVSKC